ncbi:hypothetical protein L9F63_021211 [Diploptera punctata]|uniref:Transcription factor CBF/NF-Y/archaeal histone domain-containing protein n=1 Tax=Diploptera punctata TaxID=6984 RepID=A0AAD8EC85_DIPPU|nr:hypothetical protein L9F63_021211 [Diploptera punctata]
MENVDEIAKENSKSNVTNNDTDVIQEENEPEEEKSEKMLHLPISRVRTIMKVDPEVHIASQEAVFLITKSTELFLESLAKEAYRFTAQGKRKTLQKKDIDNAIESADCLSFLEGVLDAPH